MSLHYLVKFEMLSHQTNATIGLLQEETPEFIPPQLWALNLPVWQYCKMYKICITDVNKQKQRLETEWAKMDHGVIAAAICQWHR